MNNKNKAHLFAIIVLFAGVLFSGDVVKAVNVGGTSVSATKTTAKCTGSASDVGGICVPNNTGLSGAPIYLLVSNFFSWLMAIFTILAIGAFVVSGIKYLMASGDESLAETAKKNATNAIFGIIVGLSGFIIVKAIAAALSGSGYFF